MMARISIWFVRAALLHFAVGATAGAWALVGKSGLWPGLALPVRSLHIEVALVGWVCQLAVGVALWILPFSRGVSADERFWGALGLLNAGIFLVVLGHAASLPVVILAGRVAEWTAGGLLAWGLWPRVRPLPRSRH